MVRYNIQHVYSHLFGSLSRVLYKCFYRVGGRALWWNGSDTIACFHQILLCLLSPKLRNSSFDLKGTFNDAKTMQSCTFLLLVSPNFFRGPFVGASPKIQTRPYCAWPVVRWHIMAKTSTMMPLIVLGPSSPWRQNQPWDISGDCRPCEYSLVAASDGCG